MSSAISKITYTAVMTDPVSGSVLLDMVYYILREGIVGMHRAVGGTTIPDGDREIEVPKENVERFFDSVESLVRGDYEERPSEDECIHTVILDYDDGRSEQFPGYIYGEDKVLSLRDLIYQFICEHMHTD